MHSEPGKNHEEFVLSLVNCQGSLYAYILSLVLNRDRARDLLQQTVIVLLEKEQEFQPGTNFTAWAFRVAYYEVLADHRNRKRERHLFSEQLLSLISEDAQQISSESEDRLDALRKCLGKLTESQRQLVQDRYSSNGSVQDIAQRAKKKPGAISVELHRIRNALADCINRRLRESVVS